MFLLTEALCNKTIASGSIIEACKLKSKVQLYYNTPKICQSVLGLVYHPHKSQRNAPLLVDISQKIIANLTKIKIHLLKSNGLPWFLIGALLVCILFTARVFQTFSLISHWSFQYSSSIEWRCDKSTMLMGGNIGLARTIRMFNLFLSLFYYQDWGVLKFFSAKKKLLHGWLRLARAIIVPTGRDPQSDAELWEYWVGEIQDIRAVIHDEDSNTVRISPPIVVFHIWLSSSYLLFFVGLGTRAMVLFR